MKTNLISDYYKTSLKKILIMDSYLKPNGFKEVLILMVCLPGIIRNINESHYNFFFVCMSRNFFD